MAQKRDARPKKALLVSRSSAKKGVPAGSAMIHGPQHGGNLAAIAQAALPIVGPLLGSFLGPILGSAGEKLGAKIRGEGLYLANEKRGAGLRIAGAGKKKASKKMK